MPKMKPTTNESNAESRRTFCKHMIGGLFGFSAGLGLPSHVNAQGKRAEKAKLTISRIEKFRVVVPENPGMVCDPKFESFSTVWAPIWKGPKCIIKLYGDNGFIGLGETDRFYNEEALERAIQYLTGRDVFSLNFASPSLGLPRGTDMYAFESAIYDLIGKTWGVPVYQLLGGKYQDKIAVSYWTAQWDGPGMEKIARRCVEMGYKSLKFKGRPGDPVVDEFRALQKVAPEVKVICDFNQSLKDPNEFIQLAKQLEGFNIQAIEDPLPFNIDVYREIREKVSIPLALHAGITPANIIQVMNAGICDCLNLVGPMANFVRNCMVAHAGGMKAWHGSSVEVGVTDAAFVHAIAATPNCTIGSDVLGYLIRKDDLLSKTFTVKDGFATVPDDPGLGVELDEDALKRFRV